MVCESMFMSIRSIFMNFSEICAKTFNSVMEFSRISLMVLEL
jgi:hypothetical protein